MLFDRTIYLATDHAGFLHKEAVKAWLQSEGMSVIDCGAMHYDEADDFPDFIKLAAAKVSAEPETTAAIIFGGSGQGEAMAANRYAGVRATVYYGEPASIISLSREHNDANVLSIGARFVSVDETKQVIWEWLHTAKGDDQKYQRRNLKIDARK
ncbi:MAG: RpiB/LacA/LacB family sugar-phosphate isomerase [Patescibacteria group bacterium]